MESVNSFLWFHVLTFLIKPTESAPWALLFLLARLFPTLSASFRLLINMRLCGCDAERSPARGAETRSVPLRFEEVSAACRKGATRRSAGRETAVRRCRRPFLHCRCPFTASKPANAPSAADPFFLLILPKAESLQYVSDLTSPETTRNIWLPWWMLTNINCGHAEDSEFIPLIPASFMGMRAWRLAQCADRWVSRLAGEEEKKRKKKTEWWEECVLG